MRLILVTAMLSAGCCGGAVHRPPGADQAVQDCFDVFAASDPGPVGRWRSCLFLAPIDRRWVVEDVTLLAGGRGEVSTELGACPVAAGQESCWDLADDGDCGRIGLRFEVQRTTPPPPETFTRVSYACAP